MSGHRQSFPVVYSTGPIIHCADDDAAEWLDGHCIRRSSIVLIVLGISNTVLIFQESLLVSTDLVFHSSGWQLNSSKQV